MEDILESGPAPSESHGASGYETIPAGKGKTPKAGKKIQKAGKQKTEKEQEPPLKPEHLERQVEKFKPTEGEFIIHYPLPKSQPPQVPTAPEPPRTPITLLSAESVLQLVTTQSGPRPSESQPAWAAGEIDNRQMEDILQSGPGPSESHGASGTKPSQPGKENTPKAGKKMQKAGKQKVQKAGKQKTQKDPEPPLKPETVPYPMPQSQPPQVPTAPEPPQKPIAIPSSMVIDSGDAQDDSNGAPSGSTSNSGPRNQSALNEGVPSNPKLVEPVAAASASSNLVPTKRKERPEAFHQALGPSQEEAEASVKRIRRKWWLEPGLVPLEPSVAEKLRGKELKTIQQRVDRALAPGHEKHAHDVENSRRWNQAEAMSRLGAEQRAALQGTQASTVGGLEFEADMPSADAPAQDSARPHVPQPNEAHSAGHDPLPPTLNESHVNAYWALDATASDAKRAVQQSQRSREAEQAATDPVGLEGRQVPLSNGPPVPAALPPSPSRSAPSSPESIL